MSDFAPPAGPPPPTVPEGWAARYNAQYSAWFYVNLYSKKSQWDKPTAPAEDPNAPVPSGPPPGHQEPAPTPTPAPAPAPAAAEPPKTEEKPSAERAFMEAAPPVDNATRPGAAPPSPAYSGDNRGAAGADGKEAKGGFFNKIVGQFQEKTKGAFPGQQQQQQQPTPPQERGDPYGGGAAAPPYQQQPQQQYYSSPPPQQQGYYGAPPPQQYYQPQGGYYPPPQQYQQAPAPEKKKGMGTMGGAALGIGAGLLGGALISNAISNSNEEAFEEGMAAADDDDY
ncbi:HET-domain-containing protein [Apiospora arundinis]